MMLESLIESDLLAVCQTRKVDTQQYLELSRVVALMMPVEIKLWTNFT